jgi:hypothetical protein
MNTDRHFTMKIVTSISLLVLTLSASAEDGKPSKPVFRDAVTHEQLAQALRKAEQRDPMRKLKPSEGADPSKVNQPQNLLEQSDIISFGGVATLVPKRAILSSPSGVQDRLKLEPGARIVGWADFYAANRGWITTVEVSRVQAEGNKPIAEETQDRISKSRNLVVATYLGGPISVLPLKEPEDESQTEKATP